jgi:hypothetical protein
MYGKDAGFTKTLLHQGHNIRYAVRLELTVAQLTQVTPRWGLPVQRVPYQPGDRILVFIGDEFASGGTPAPLVSTCFVRYDPAQGKIVTHTGSGVDGSHLLGANPHGAKWHTLYISASKCALHYGPPEALTTTPEFWHKVIWDRQFTPEAQGEISLASESEGRVIPS